MIKRGRKGEKNPKNKVKLPHLFNPTLIIAYAQSPSLYPMIMK